MKFQTTQYKIKQAKFHLQKLEESYVEDNHTVDYYLDAFLASCRSVIDYMQRDFLNSIRPKLSNKEKRLISKHHEIKIEHTQKQVINAFLKDIWKDFTDFKNNDPMRCYLFEKRDIFTHNEFAGSMGGTFTENSDGSKIFDKRYLESQIMVMLEQQMSKEIIDIGECNLSKTERNSLIQQLAYEDMRQFLRKFIKDLEDFVKDMEDKYCKSLNHKFEQ